jgi:flagellar motility protein MotE (MotC chaperone)
MKRLATILILLLGMTLSFAVIGFIVLFATGTVNNLQDASDLLAGRKPGESTPTTATQPDQIQNAVQALTQHKNELEQDISKLQQSAKDIQQQKAKLEEDLKALQDNQGQQGAAGAEQRAQRKTATVALFDGMRPGEAAGIMDNLGDDLVLELLADMDPTQAARIITALGNDQRKATLIEKFLTSKK